MSVRLIAAALLCLFFAGCTSVAYYAQAVQGQMRLMVGARPIPEVVNDTATDPGLRQQLERTIAIREFASSELALPDNGSYRSYADLGRPYVVWNVFAAPEFSLEPQQWCMVFIGCVNYRGYYDKNDAELYAGELRQAGADTHVSGVPAYSTLGYFNDPVLNTFLRFGEQEVARIIFHELAHQLVYAEGDSAFNESFATAVENEGMRRWLNQSAPQERLRDFARQLERKAQFQRLLADSRDKLRALYASALEPDAKRRAKAGVIAAMRQSYADLKSSWGGYAGYDQWFSQPINNATLGSVSLYAQWVPAFQAMLEQEGGSLPRFYLRVAGLAHLTKAERSAELAKFSPSLTGSAEPSPDSLALK
ncbi:MAG: aminopeptidase [Nitrosomonadales bacterium]|nr:aminopeptidase [Nitrosomonadales bacterium]